MRISALLTTIFLIASVAVHFIQAERNPITDALSYYMNGRHGWLVSLALISIAAASLLLVPSQRGAGRIFLVLWSLGAIVGGIFPPDPIGQWNRPPSPSGITHAIAAFIAFTSFPPAAWLLSKHKDTKMLAALSTLSLFVFVLCFSPVLKRKAPFALGLTERIVLALYAAWLLAAAREPQPATSA